jgi:Glycosyl transferase family 2
MKLIGLMPARNEDWVLGLSARVALQWCDEIAILMHECTDSTAQIVADLHSEFPGRIGDVDAAGPWDEMKHRQRLLDNARAEGATHIAMIDADEVLTANLVDSIRDYIDQLAPGQMLDLPGYNLRSSLEHYHANGIWGNRWFSVAFKDTPEAHWAGDKFHSRNPAGVTWRNYRPIKQDEGGVMHLWGASERRLIAKHALYKVVERLRFPEKPITVIDRLYSLAIKPRETWLFDPVPAAWHHEQLEYKYCFPDAVPWQEAEVRRLVAEHGRGTFDGLDLFGLV